MRAVAHRLLGRFENVFRRLEVGLADAEVDDRQALGLSALARSSTVKAVSSSMAATAGLIFSIRSHHQWLDRAGG
jgi:uncharacterized membrane protein